MTDHDVITSKCAKCGQFKYEGIEMPPHVCATEETVTDACRLCLRPAYGAVPFCRDCNRVVAWAPHLQQFALALPFRTRADMERAVTVRSIDVARVVGELTLELENRLDALERRMMRMERSDD